MKGNPVGVSCTTVNLDVLFESGGYYEDGFDISEAEHHSQNHAEAGGAVDDHCCEDGPRYV